MQYTRNGKKISAEEFNRTKNMVGAAKEGGAKGVLDHMVSGAKGMFGGMFGGLQGAVMILNLLLNRWVELLGMEI